MLIGVTGTSGTKLRHGIVSIEPAQRVFRITKGATMQLRLTALTLLPTMLRAQEVALLHSPAADSESGGSLAEQFRLLRWAPAVPPPTTKHC